MIADWTIWLIDTGLAFSIGTLFGAWWAVGRGEREQ